MSHNEYIFLAGNNFTESLRLHTSLDTGILLYLLALASIVNDILRCLHNRLVSAPPKCEINRIARKLIILRIGQTIQTDTDADGNRHFISDINGLHIL